MGRWGGGDLMMCWSVDVAQTHSYFTDMVRVSLMLLYEPLTVWVTRTVRLLPTLVPSRGPRSCDRLCFSVVVSVGWCVLSFVFFLFTVIVAGERVYLRPIHRCWFDSTLRRPLGELRSYHGLGL